MAWAVGLLQTQAFTVKANNLQLLLCIGFILAAARAHGTGFPEECGVFAADELRVSYEPYSKVTEPTLSPNHLQDLPGFTRSFYKRDHALITPESQVFGPLQSWLRTTAAFLISPATGSHFSMYLAKMEENSTSGTLGVGIERFIFVVKGDLVLSTGFEGSQKLSVDSFVYVPPNFKHSLHCDSSATIVVFERRYEKLTDEAPKLIVGSTYNQPVLETPGEVFILRKLLPTSAEYDFNVHVMDFQPGEYLNVKTWKHF